MESVIKVKNLEKIYEGGFKALKNINLEIKSGEIFALLGPNGAGKTTLIGIICGIVNASSGKIKIDDFDIVSEYRKARQLVGLVPQELTTDAFESVFNTVSFSRGLFGKPRDDKFIDSLLEKLSLKDKRNNRLMTLSGGMKRRVMIAKALSHEPRVLFLDEPTAGVDVELRKDMWEQVRLLRETGVTVILTTHYIDEAEEMADRIGIINRGEIILVEEKQSLMKKLGQKALTLDLLEPLNELPSEISGYKLSLDSSGEKLTYSYDGTLKENRIPELLNTLMKNNIGFRDLNTNQSSLEEIFVKLVKG